MTQIKNVLDVPKGMFFIATANDDFSFDSNDSTSIKRGNTYICEADGTRLPHMYGGFVKSLGIRPLDHMVTWAYIPILEEELWSPIFRTFEEARDWLLQHNEKQKPPRVPKGKFFVGRVKDPDMIGSCIETTVGDVVVGEGDGTLHPYVTKSVRLAHTCRRIGDLPWEDFAFMHVEAVDILTGKYYDTLKDACAAAHQTLFGADIPTATYAVEQHEHATHVEDYPGTLEELITLKDGNPKDAIGAAKMNMHLIPQIPLAHIALSFTEGAAKYGAFNYEVLGVRASIYMSAAQRHIAKWFTGENVDPESKVHHLASACASLMIIMDAEERGKLVDDRPPSFNMESLFQRLNKIHQDLQTKYANMSPKHYTELNKNDK